MRMKSKPKNLMLLDICFHIMEKDWLNQIKSKDYEYYFWEDDFQDISLNLVFKISKKEKTNSEKDKYLKSP